MKVRSFFTPIALGLAFAGAFLLSNLGRPSVTVQATSRIDELASPQEKHLRNIKQLTFGGENAEAYFSGDGKQLIFQSKRETRECDQIYLMNSDGSNQHMVSTGMGRTTCSYIFPNHKRILYGSTHLGDKQCPPPVDFSQGYAWAVYPAYDIFTAKPDGSDVKRLTKTDGYDAEATMSTDGKKIVFTSMRDGDLDIYTMDADGKNVKRVTSELGYDGGPWFSNDGKQIVYRAYHPKTDEEIRKYKDKLAQNLIVPTVFEIWVMNVDGTNKRQVTNYGLASWAPFFSRDGKKIIFCTNYFDPERNKPHHQPDFDIAMINVDGTGLEQITFNQSFDGFPMFSPDGKKLVFASNRNSAKPGDTNVFIADWVE